MKKSSGLLVCFFLISCTSTYTSLQNLKPEATKQQVRNILGKPKVVGRWDGMDRWTYKFKLRSQQYTQDVFFDEGKFQKTGPLTPYPNYQKKLEEAENLDEYEILAKLRNKQKAKGFREINSLNPATDFCFKRFSNKSAHQCKTLLKNNTFQAQALRFCDQKIPSSHKLKCLRAVSDKKFHFLALDFCKQGVKQNFKLNCLNIISSKQFHPRGLQFCQRSPKSLQLKCLKNLGTNKI